MPDKVTKALLEEIAQLRVELEATDLFKEIQALERIVARREAQNGEAAVTPDVTTSVTRGPFRLAIAAPISVIKSRVEKLLEGVKAPVPIKEIYARLEAEGIVVPGDSPQNNLSAHLSRDENFTSWGRSGWTLASSIVPDVEKIADLASKYAADLPSELRQVAEVAIKRDDLTIPAEVDKELLQVARESLGRNLVAPEKHSLRNAFRAAIISGLF